MKKPKWNWRLFLRQMEPGESYTYNQVGKMIKATDLSSDDFPTVAEIRAILEMCKNYVYCDVTGKYSLTAKATETDFQKFLNNDTIS